MTTTARGWVGPATALICTLAVGWVAVRSMAAVASVAPTAADLADACNSTNPYVITTRYLDDVRGAGVGAGAVLIALRDAADGVDDHQVRLATYGQVGTVYGLAYDAPRQHVYAASYVKRGSLLVAGGPGTISRIDLSTGAVGRWATLDAGPANIHRITVDGDAAATSWVGRAGLGDIDADAAGTQLFAANLFDGRIYRISLPDGTVLGSFAHGATGESWGAGLRPFGLSVHGNRLYHGVVEPVGASLGLAGPVGHVYASRLDGSDVRRVAAFRLDSVDAPVAPLPWPSETRAVISDIEWRETGEMIIALRNLELDATLGDVPARAGDLFPAVPEGDAWRAVVAPERYDDGFGGRDESTTGGITVLPGLDLVVATGMVTGTRAWTSSAVWLDGATGRAVRLEDVHYMDLARGMWPLPGSGDVEVLCGPDASLDPDRVASATAASAWAATGTAAAATAAATQGTARTATITVTALTPTGTPVPIASPTASGTLASTPTLAATAVNSATPGPPRAPLCLPLLLRQGWLLARQR